MSKFWHGNDYDNDDAKAIAIPRVLSGNSRDKNACNYFYPMKDRSNILSCV